MSNQLSVNLKTDIEKELPQIIEFNFEPLKKELSATLEKYDGIIVTEDGIKDAKSTRADLNRFKKSLNDTRIAVGKSWNRPYDSFKAQMDELISMVDKPAAAIDAQIKAFETAEQDKKRNAITSFYNNNAKELKDILPLERIWDEKWLNKGTELIAATSQMHGRMEDVRKDLKTIDMMEIEHKDYLLNSYLRTLNIGAALDERRKYEDEQRALKKAQEKPAPVVEAPAVPQASAAVQLHSEIDATPAPRTETRRDIDVRFYDTTPAFRAEMKALTAKHNIKYGGISNGS